MCCLRIVQRCVCAHAFACLYFTHLCVSARYICVFAHMRLCVCASHICVFVHDAFVCSHSSCGRDRCEQHEPNSSRGSQCSVFDHNERTGTVRGYHCMFTQLHPSPMLTHFHASPKTQTLCISGEENCIVCRNGLLRVISRDVVRQCICIHFDCLVDCNFGDEYNENHEHVHLQHSNSPIYSPVPESEFHL